MLIRRIARPLLSAAFIGQGADALRNPKAAAEAAQPTMQGLHALPDAVASKVPRDVETFARINAAVQIGGGVLLATGKMPRLASAALAGTVIPGSLGAHMFWSEVDPERKAQKRREFLTDLSLLGGLIIASADTAGKPSLRWRGRQAAGRISEAVSAALPLRGSGRTLLDSDLGEKIGHVLQVGAERGHELASAAAEKSAPVAETARRRSAELAGAAAEKSAPLVEAARERGSEWADIARERGTELAEIARERGSQLAGTPPARGGELVDTTRKRFRDRRKH
jgi:uncharacterized membrane protein YphA (DoxX/SURF4 family)